MEEKKGDVKWKMWEKMGCKTGKKKGGGDV